MGKRIYDLRYFKDLAITKGGECLSHEYVSCVIKIKLIRIPYTIQNIDVHLLNKLDGVMKLVC